MRQSSKGSSSHAVQTVWLLHTYFSKPPLAWLPGHVPLGSSGNMLPGRPSLSTQHRVPPTSCNSRSALAHLLNLTAGLGRWSPNLTTSHTSLRSPGHPGQCLGSRDHVGCARSHNRTQRGMEKLSYPSPCSPVAALHAKSPQYICSKSSVSNKTQVIFHILLNTCVT